mmetsp:Transcript_33108/g.105676  ORF Transcript_33108/g.105676 Transcript_33108/m.105676 type:complete len:401 (-) Transcript_33108:27-1229(-)
MDPLRRRLGRGQRHLLGDDEEQKEAVRGVLFRKKQVELSLESWRGGPPLERHQRQLQGQQQGHPGGRSGPRGARPRGVVPGLDAGRPVPPLRAAGLGPAALVDPAALRWRWTRRRRALPPEVQLRRPRGGLRFDDEPFGGGGGGTPRLGFVVVGSSGGRHASTRTRTRTRTREGGAAQQLFFLPAPRQDGAGDGGVSAEEAGVVEGGARGRRGSQGHRRAEGSRPGVRVRAAVARRRRNPKIRSREKDHRRARRALSGSHGLAVEDERPPRGRSRRLRRVLQGRSVARELRVPRAGLVRQGPDAPPLVGLPVEPPPLRALRRGPLGPPRDLPQPRPHGPRRRREGGRHRPPRAQNRHAERHVPRHRPRTTPRQRRGLRQRQRRRHREGCSAAAAAAAATV